MHIEIDAVARALTPALKKGLQFFHYSPVTSYPESLSAGTLRRLIECGLVDEVMPNGSGLVKWRLTERGSAIRVQLQT
jgi:hypothetical protein